MIFFKDDTFIYYEVRGEGQPLLLIHGVVVDAWLYENTAKILSKHYKVITYDRRGSSRSQCNAHASFDMDAQVSDVRDLLNMLGIEKTIICGASAGAVIGLYFMQCYPAMVEKLIMYEPPMLSLMDDGGASKQWVAMVEELIARGKYNTAALKFMESIGPVDERAPKKPDDVAMREMYNIQPFLKNEYSVFMRYVPDIEWCRSMAGKMLVAVGEKSGDHPYAAAAKHFAKITGAKLLYYPGYHNLPADLPEEFAVCVMGTLML